MYQTIYDVVEKRGRVKTGILLNGKDAGLKYLSEEGGFFYPEGAERKKRSRRIPEGFRGSSRGNRRCEKRR